MLAQEFWVSNYDGQPCTLPFHSPAISRQGSTHILYTGCNYGLSK